MDGGIIGSYEHYHMNLEHICIGKLVWSKCVLLDHGSWYIIKLPVLQDFFGDSIQLVDQ